MAYNIIVATCKYIVLTAGFHWVVVSHYLDIGMPRLNTVYEVTVTALSEGFSPLVVSLELLPYQRADKRLSS